MSRFKCNGMGDSSARLKMTQEQRKTMSLIFGYMRPAFMEAYRDKEGRGGEFHFGIRFSNDEDLLIRILSQTTVEDMMAFPIEWTQAAMLDCASADHWYTYEKQWE